MTEDRLSPITMFLVDNTKSRLPIDMNVSGYTNIIPMMPPIRLKKMASNKNCHSIKLLLAPNDF
jgi:hypothetical protein